MEYAIKITDQNGSPIGERMDASAQDVLKYISKGLRVFDIQTEREITESMVVSSIGVSDGTMAI